MDIHSILARHEADRQTETVTAKLYRYMGLMQTISLFSQRLSREQCLDIAFESVNELITIAHAVLYAIEPEDGRSATTSGLGASMEGQLTLRKAKGIENAPSVLPMSAALKTLPLIGAGVIMRQKGITEILGTESCEALQIHALVPFVEAERLVGVVLISDKASGSFDNDDVIMLEALMHLANGAMESNRRYEALVQANLQMDGKVFDLLTINQAARLMMGEASLETLAHLSVDVFSELTRSSKTGFYLFNETSGRQELLAWLNTMNKEETRNHCLSHQWENLPGPLPKVLDLHKVEDRQWAEQLFPGSEAILREMETTCLILLKHHGHVAGFVSLGERLDGNPYPEDLFEVIESLAAATSMAVENARLIEALGQQKKDLNERLERLLSLSTLIKNINSSGNLETLLELTGRTLEASFSVKRGMLMLWDGERDCFDIVRNIGLEGSGCCAGSGAWKTVLNGGVVCDMGTKRIREFFPAAILPDLNGAEGILIEPIHHTDVQKTVMGAIVVLAFEGSSIRDAENLLTMEAISNHLSLMIMALTSLGRQRRFRMPEHVEIFKRKLKERIKTARETDQPFVLLQVSDQRGYIFRDNHLAHRLKAHYEQVYPVAHNDAFVFPQLPEEPDVGELQHLFDEEEVRVRRLLFSKDFDSYKSFFDLL